MLVPTFTLTALATFAHASGNNIAHPAHVNRDLVPRQTGSDPLAGAACASDLLSIAGSLPTPPAALLTGDFATVTDPCSYSVPTSLASEFSSYSSELISWVSAIEPQVSSALAKCPELAGELAGPIAEASNSLLCSTSAPGLGGGSNAPAPTGSAGGAGAGGSGGSGSTPTGGSGTKAPGNTSTAGGPKETGFAVGVMAFAGLIGAVAAL